MRPEIQFGGSFLCILTPKYPLVSLSQMKSITAADAAVGNFVVTPKIIINALLVATAAVVSIRPGGIIPQMMESTLFVVR